MSNRQIRRLQELLDTKSGQKKAGNLDDDDEVVDDDTSTMLVKTSKKKSKPKPRLEDDTLLVSTEANKNNVVPPVAKVVSQKESSPTNSCKAGSKGARKEQGNDLDDRLTASEMLGALTKQKKAEQKKKKQRMQDEEEKLLDALVSPEGGHIVDGAPGAKASTNENATTKRLRQIGLLLTLCDTQRLNARLERIKSFGIESVEDVGDGTRRNGVPAQNNLLPNRPQGVPLPRFRESPFVTPNRYNWPNFTTYGVHLKATSGEKRRPQKDAALPSSQETHSASKRSVYTVDWSDAEFHAAQKNFDEVVQSMADVNTFIQVCFSRYPYHVPTLLQLSNTFAIMGDQPNSQMMLDFALYFVGVVMSRFPLSQGVTQRVMPFKEPSNRLVFEVLRHGVHLAVKRGCTKTAFNIARLLLSLDEEDPMAVLLSWDYLALRSKSWDALLLTYAHCEAQLKERETALSGVDEGTGSNNPEVDEGSAACRRLIDVVAALPGFHFNAALAKFLREQEEEQTRINNASSGAGKKRTEDVIPVSPSDLELLGSLPSARVMLADAILTFPHVALELAKKIDVEINTTRDGWDALIALDASHRKSFGSMFLTDHLASIFVERSFELWKPKDAAHLFQRAVAMLADDAFMSDSKAFSMRWRREVAAVAQELRAYKKTSLDDVLGVKVSQIAPELLHPGANAEEAERDGRNAQMDHLRGQGFPQGELDALERLEAVFGPLPLDTPLEQRFAIYDEMLQDYRRQIGDDTNPVVLFLQTLLPWNNLRDMALERAMEARGVVDPVRVRNRRRRENDEVVWRDAAREAQQQQDEASSSSDDGW